jgi:hypothetical protein
MNMQEALNKAHTEGKIARPKGLWKNYGITYSFRFKQFIGVRPDPEEGGSGAFMPSVDEMNTNWEALNPSEFYKKEK